MDRSRHFLFNVPDLSPMSSKSEDHSSSSGGVEDLDNNGSGQIASHPGSGSNSTELLLSPEEYERLICENPDIFLSSGVESQSHSHEASATFGHGGNFIWNVTGFLELGDRPWCNATHDQLLCWPRTPEGTSVTQTCFAVLNGIPYDTSRTVSRTCQDGGIWEEKVDYLLSCKPLHSPEADESILEIQIYMYIFGYCLSLSALIAAMVIFLSFTRQMPWSTSKARKMFRGDSPTAEQTNPLEATLVLSDNRSSSALLRKAKASLKFKSQEDDYSPFAASFATLLMGKMISSSMPDLSVCEQVSKEELELRCLRNKIHIQLIITYIMAAALWIITNFTTMSTTMSHKGSMSSQVSCVTFILLHYFHLTNFFWMFVEGLYLYVIVVKTFTARNIRLRVYSFIGWGLPFLVVVNWCVVRWFTKDPPKEERHITTPVPESLGTTPATLRAKNSTAVEFNTPCPWIVTDVYDWFYMVPALMVLLANIIFLIRIMLVLITKLRSATNQQETQLVQSRKAAKALAVLMPLLGITYVLTIAGPKKSPAYDNIRALLISTQGFLVALLYCFINGEVKTALRARWSRCQLSGRCCGWEIDRRRRLQQVQDSHSCRTESIRLCTPTIENTDCKGEYASTEFKPMATNHNGASDSHNGNSNSRIQPPLNASAVKRLSTPISSSFNSHKIYNIPNV